LLTSSDLLLVSGRVYPMFNSRFDFPFEMRYSIRDALSIRDLISIYTDLERFDKIFAYNDRADKLQEPFLKIEEEKKDLLMARTSRIFSFSKVKKRNRNDLPEAGGLRKT
jgi:hypothetical protein